MKTAPHTFKYCYLCLLVCLLSGCAKGPRQQGIWPWEYGKETGNYQTGDYVTVSGPVGHFGDAPKAAKPIAPETLEPKAPAPPPPTKQQETKTEPLASLPTAGTPGPAKAVGNTKGTYDFSVESVKTAQPSYMPAYPGQTTYDITAINHGDAPVSVTIGADPKASVNLHTDKSLPLTAVVPPHTEQALVHCGPKMKSEPFSLKYTFSWSIGDYRTSHNSPEHYRLPFGRNTRAYVNVADKAGATPYTRYSVIFSMPAGTPVLAARKGTVVRITADDRIDILHDDATIATYNHLLAAEDLFVGKAVAAGVVIGRAGTAENPKEAYLQLTVWRPEPAPNASLQTIAPGSGFDLVSLPLEFCVSGPSDCRVLTRDQWLPGKATATPKKQVKRRTK